MSDMRNLGVKITLDIEREMIFNLNVLDACVEKFGKMDDLFQELQNMNTVVWLAVQMLNESAEIHNEEHPDNKIPSIDEKKLKRYIVGLGGIQEFQKKVQDAILKGLPEEAVKQVEELGEQIAAQMKDGKMVNWIQRRTAEKSQK